MSFSSRVKTELKNHITTKDCCKKTELAANLRVAGLITYLPDGRISLKTHHTSYEVRKNDPMFAESGIVIGETDLIYEQFIGNSKKCCKKTYVKSAFSSNGSVSDPDKEYHLEIICRDGMIAEELSEFLEEFGIEAKVVERKNHYVLYVKEAEQIEDFLNYIGAHNCMMEFENVRILKEVRNNVNRQVNCETANIQKTVDASMRQIESIRYLIDRGIFERLPLKLKEVASLRLENPDADLNELCQMLDNPIGKSGLNHRFRKLDEIAREDKHTQKLR